jgi:adenylate cyclase
MGSRENRSDIVTIVFVFFVAILLEYVEAFSLVEDETLSYRQILRTHYASEEFTTPSEDILIVYTDEVFYADYDKFPLRRVDLSTLVVRLREMGAAVIGLDMILDFNSAYGEDPTLANAFREVENVLLVSQAEIVDGEFVQVNTAIPKFDELTSSGYSNISSNSAISESLTRLHIYPEIGEQVDEWPFAVKAVSMFLDADPELFKGNLYIGDDLEIGLDQFSELYIDYPLLPLGEEGVARLHEIIGLSASEILFAEDEEELEDLAFLVEGKIVLIGEVAEVAHDEFETPVGNVYGVNIIANSISTILRNGPLQAAPIWVETLVAFILLVVFLFTRVMQAPLKRNLISFGAVLVFIVGAVMAYVNAGLILSMSYLLLASLFTIGIINIRFYLNEMGQKALIRDAFGQYLSPKVVSDLVKDPEKLTLGGEEREMTAYFSDIAGFSSFSEKLTPTELVNVLNDYLTEMCNIIIGLEGTVDKFEGDAIIAFWGAPTVQQDHAKLACFASIDMNKALVPLRDKWVAEGRPSISVRMGLNSGPMVVGNMGSAQRMNYTIMGDVVNLAARLEGANKVYNSGLMISEATYGACQSDIDVRELDTIRVVGKSEPVKVYQLLERKNQTENSIADLVEKFERALDLYKDGNYKDALSGFESCVQFSPEDGPSLVYVDRCRDFIATPPAANWDGVFTMESKG